jgi:hypothetical protein
MKGIITMAGKAVRGSTRDTSSKGMASDDSRGGLKDNIDDADTAPNSGIYESSVGMGQTMVRAFGMDKSSNHGPASAEQGGKFNGGPRDLSHSLGTGDQSAAPTPGRKDTTY